MNLRRCLLFSYRFLLYLYPYAFRRRFATEMMEVAAEAESAEWPLIFGDTGLAILRSWLDPAEASLAPVPDRDTYVAIGGAGLSARRLFQGLALALALILGITYLGSLGYLQAPKCHAIAAENIS